MKKGDVYPTATGVTFEDLSIGKRMTNKEILGLMLRDDLFLNVITDNPTEEICEIWRSMVGSVKRNSGSGGEYKSSLKKAMTTVGSPKNDNLYAAPSRYPSRI